MNTSAFSRMFVNVCVILCAVAGSSVAQTKCPPVTARNAQEALRIEQTDNKNGCWVRDASDQLVFVSDLAPNRNYKAILNVPKSSGCNPVLRSRLAPGFQNPQSAGGLAGTWNVTAGVWPGESELALIQTFGKSDIQTINNCPAVDLNTFQQTIVRLSDGRYCSGSNQQRVCLSESGEGSYSIQRGTYTCNYALDGAVLRGACSDSTIPGRIELMIGRRISP